MSQVLRAFSRPFAQGWISIYSDRSAVSLCESFWVCSSSTCIFTISNSSCLDKMLRSHGPYLFPNWKWVIWNQLSGPSPSKILFPQKNLWRSPKVHSSSHAPVHVPLGEDSWEVLQTWPKWIGLNVRIVQKMVLAAFPDLFHPFRQILQRQLSTKWKGDSNNSEL